VLAALHHLIVWPRCVEFIDVIQERQVAFVCERGASTSISIASLEHFSSQAAASAIISPYETDQVPQAHEQVPLRPITR
jgi:hypothetical protein